VTPRRRTPAGSLRADQRGAIMVMGVFMATLMVAFVYYVEGLGAAISYRERMQDAADAGAYSSAAVHARGMNLLSMINLSMAGVLAVGTGLRATETWAGDAAREAHTLVLFDQRDALDAIQRKAIDLWGPGQVARNMFAVLRASNTAANAVATAIPLAARMRAIEAATSSYRPPVESAIAYPDLRRLPVEEAPLPELTDRAGRHAVPLARTAIGGFSVAAAMMGRWGDEAMIGRLQTVARTTLTGIDQDVVVDGMRPKRLSLNEPGGERFLVGVAVGGTYEFGMSERGVKLASWGQDEQSAELQLTLELMSKVALAQAEYYFAGTAEPALRLWSQEWKARMRRVRFPADAACTEASRACEALKAVVRQGLDRAVVH
jgi:hypothetical protein